jgi:hypothetical protein
VGQKSTKLGFHAGAHDPFGDIALDGLSIPE